MLLEIDEYSDEPIYQQLIDQIILGIAHSSPDSQEPLPTVRQLAEELGVNTMTVSKAYSKLKQEGYIVTDRRNGTKIVTTLPQTESWQTELNKSLELLLAKAALHQQAEVDIHQQVTAIYQKFNEKRTCS